jgi:hypothetical protein
MINNQIKVIMTEYGDSLVEYLKMRKQRLGDRGVKDETNFKTMWNVAENEGRKRELLDLITDLEKICQKEN